MQSPQTRQSQKNIDRWWLKYETIAHDDAIVSHEEFIEFAGAAYEAWLQSGKTAAQIEADTEHHIAVQKVFKKWREVYGDKI